MPDEDALSVAVDFIRDLANGSNLSLHPSEFTLSATNGTSKPGTPAGRITLPGEPTPAKTSLQHELAALFARVQYLETQASASHKQVLPDTPNGSGGPTSPFAAYGSTSSPQTSTALPLRSHSGSGSARQAHVSSLLSGRNRNFSDEDFEHLREHVDKQTQEIKMQRNTITQINEQLQLQQEEAHHNFVIAHNAEIDKLQKELRKNQQANLAFRKILKDIGTIVTNVANGDLSCKVQINDKEMDDEIRDFKIVINTMMDQLQVFGSEVSRVAREVGTEGKLGGQAQITGVNGIWKELTNNGKSSNPKRLPESTNSPQSTKWQRTLPCKSARSQMLPRR